MKKHGILRICFIYALSKLSEKIIDQIIIQELSKNQKINFLCSMSNRRICIMLLKIGFKRQFLKSVLHE